MDASGSPGTDSKRRRSTLPYNQNLLLSAPPSRGVYPDSAALSKTFKSAPTTFGNASNTSNNNISNPALSSQSKNHSLKIPQIEQEAPIGQPNLNQNLLSLFSFENIKNTIDNNETLKRLTQKAKQFISNNAGKDFANVKINQNSKHVKHKIKQEILGDDNKENHPYFPNILMKHKRVPMTSPLNTKPTIQTVMADAISPSIVGPTNIRFVTTVEREQRDKQVTEALNIISQSMEPPIHNVDRYKDWLLNGLKSDGTQNYGAYDGDTDENYLYRIMSFLLGTPLTIFRFFWHYIILEIHLVYNLLLLYFTVYATPPIFFFIIGLTLFWIKVIYELYRDIMHRDDPVYDSNIPKEMSIAAAISASFGFILNMRAQNGEITEAWWRGENNVPDFDYDIDVD